MAIGLGFSLLFFFFPDVTLSFPCKIQSIMMKTFLFPLTGGQCCPVQALLQSKKRAFVVQLVTAQEKSPFQSTFFHEEIFFKCTFTATGNAAIAYQTRYKPHH